MIFQDEEFEAIAVRCQELEDEVKRHDERGREAEASKKRYEEQAAKLGSLLEQEHESLIESERRADQLVEF